MILLIFLRFGGHPPTLRGGFGTGIVESCKSWKFQCAPQARFFLDLQACIRGDFYVLGNSNWIGVRLASLSVGFWYPLQQNTLNLPSFPYIPKKSPFFAYIPKIQETPPHPRGGFGTNNKITPFLKNISPMFEASFRGTTLYSVAPEGVGSE